MPAERKTVERLRTNCNENFNSKRSPQQIWEDFFFGTNPSQTLYNLDVCYSLLMPGTIGTNSGEKAFDFQMAFIRAKGIPAIDSMLTR